MLQHAAIPAQGHDPGFAQGDIDAASLGKSFDYRARCTASMCVQHAIHTVFGHTLFLELQVLNFVVYALRGQRPNPLLLEFLRVDEHLVDIGDDLVDYEDDVARCGSKLAAPGLGAAGPMAPGAACGPRLRSP